MGLNDLVAKSEFPEATQYIKDVERTSPAGSVILTEKFVEDVLAPWYLKNFQEPEDGDGGDGDGEGEGDGYAAGYNTTCNIRATLVKGDWDNKDYSEGYRDGYAAGAFDCKNK